MVVFAAMVQTGCTAMSYLGYRISPDYPPDETMKLNLEGLEGQVKVYLDHEGIPHIHAHSELDLMRVVGFMQARSRFFQMDTLRRYARGRLSELVGEQRVPLGTTVELDFSMRGWGFERKSKEEAASLDPEARKLMMAYVDGVNAALKLYPPVEYRLLDVEPEPWTIADTFAVAYIIAWGITHNWRQELSRVVIASYVGTKRASEIYPHTSWPGATAISAHGTEHVLPPAVVDEVKELFTEHSLPPENASLGQKDGHHINDGDSMAEGLWFGKSQLDWASNAWVVGGALSKSGLPLLSNDPHLPHMLPSIVFQQHLHCEGLDVIGATVPGLPLVLMGHNRHVAWGMTSAVADAADLYIEKLDEGDGNKVMGPDGAEPIFQDLLEVKVRDGSEYKTVKRLVRRTKRGSLINDLYPEVLPDWAPLISVHTGSMNAGKGILGLRKADRATTVEELRDAMMNMASPINSIMAADLNGTIAVFATGKIPLRTAFRGTFPVPAWKKEYAWNTMLTKKQMPMARGGSKDFFAHANSLMMDPKKSDVLFQIDSAPSYRLDRISEMIREKNKHDYSTFASIQGDVFLERAKALVPLMLQDLHEMTQLSTMQANALQKLEKWDFRATVDSVATTVFFVTYRQCIIGAMQDEVGPRGVDYLLKQRYFTNAVDRWFPDKAHVVWDDRSTEQVEHRDFVVQKAFVRAVDWLASEYGQDTSKWTWGRLHDMHPMHTFGKKVSAFSFDPVPAPGALDAVWKAHFDMGHPTTPYRANYGPVYRMIVDLADMEHGKWIVDTGSSGWPLSPHYHDQFQRWRNLGFVPMNSNWDEIRKSSDAVITFANDRP